jgi:hypothetical protein
MEEELIKTIQEVSKFGTKALETGEKLGGFLSRVFGKLPEDLVGLAGKDYISHARIRNLLKLEQRTDAIRKERGFKKDSSPLSPNIAIPLLEAAQDESREELQELWARMLANALDPNRSNAVRQNIIETVRKFDPIDAKVLETASKIASSDSYQYIKTESVKERLKVPLGEFEVSLKNLEGQDCILLFYGGGGSSSAKAKGAEPTATFKITHLGHEILRACNL